MLMMDTIVLCPSVVVVELLDTICLECSHEQCLLALFQTVCSPSPCCFHVSPYFQTSIHPSIWQSNGLVLQYFMQQT
eukprot:477806-Hanusia_phi.AAC.1